MTSLDCQEALVWPSTGAAVELVPRDPLCMIDDRVIQRIGGPQYHQLGPVDEHEDGPHLFVSSVGQPLNSQPVARNEVDKRLTFGSNDKLLKTAVVRMWWTS